MASDEERAKEQLAKGFIFGVLMFIAVIIIAYSAAAEMNLDGDQQAPQPAESVDCYLNWNHSTMVCFASDGVNVTIHSDSNTDIGGFDWGVKHAE